MLYRGFKLAGCFLGFLPLLSAPTCPDHARLAAAAGAHQGQETAVLQAGNQLGNERFPPEKIACIGFLYGLARPYVPVEELVAGG